MQFSDVASAVNYFSASSSATGNQLAFQGTGSDTNINFLFGTKGTGTFVFANAAGAKNILTLNGAVTSANYVDITAAVASSSPTISAVGADTNINLNLAAKGSTGAVALIANGALGFSVGNPASAVNYLAVQGNVTTSNPSLTATGSDTNVGMTFVTKGSGGYAFTGYAGSTNLFSLSSVASAVNYVSFTNNATGSNPAIFASGSDANITMQIQGKGTGGVYIVGVSTNSAAVTGQVGELLSATNLAASPITFSNGVAKTLQSITLTAGDWDVWGSIFCTATTVTLGKAGLFTTTNTLPDNSLQTLVVPLATGAALALMAPQLPFSVAGSTTIYLVGQFSGTGTLSCSGGIYARRRR
jgi:hypothetical protein